ncbi:MAG: hypothetical protein ACREBE_08110 [bacterium]
MIAFRQTAEPQGPPGQARVELREQIRDVGRELKETIRRREQLNGRLEHTTGAEADQLRAQLRELDVTNAQLESRLSGLVGTLTKTEVEGRIAQVVAMPPVRAFGGTPFGIDSNAVSTVFVILAVAIIAPLSLAVMRRMWRQPQPAMPVPRDGDAIPQERLLRLEQAMEAIAIEIERIAEGQRFVTKLLTERSQAGQKAGEETSKIKGA